jgi:hypothetical protein
MPGGCASAISIDWVFAWLLYIVRKAMLSTHCEHWVRYARFHVAFALCFALLLYAHLTWLVAWLSCLPCRNWCNIIIIKAFTSFWFALHDFARHDQ